MHRSVATAFIAENYRYGMHAFFSCSIVRRCLTHRCFIVCQYLPLAKLSPPVMEKKEKGELDYRLYQLLANITSECTQLFRPWWIHVGLRVSSPFILFSFASSVPSACYTATDVLVCCMICMSFESNHHLR